MSIGVENGDYIGVPESGIERPPMDLRFRFRYLSGDRVEVHHPFHGPKTLGDQSAFSDSCLDAAAVVLMQELPYLIDSRKLNRIARFETRPFASEYSELSHCFSLGLIANEFGGGPMDVIDGLFNDASKAYDGHKSDDKFQNHGTETYHDLIRSGFFTRVGLIDALIDADALRREDSGIYVGKTRLSIEKLLSEDEVTIRRSFLSNKHKSRRMDGDRFQYNEEERMLVNYARYHGQPHAARVALAIADQALGDVMRRTILEDDEGDQLIFKDPDICFQSSSDYVGHNSEHWNDAMQDFINDLLNLADMYFFVCEHRHASSYQVFHPQDYLHTSATLMTQQLDTIAKDELAMRWLLDTAEHLAKDQRARHLHNLQTRTDYAGPMPPDGVRLTKLDRQAQRENVGVKDGVFYIELPTGKVRTIDPRVNQNGGSSTTPLSVIRPEYRDLANYRQQWIGDYRAEIVVEDHETQEAIARSLELIKCEWPKAKKRHPMPVSELRLSIKEANDFVLQAGRIQVVYS